MGHRNVRDILGNNLGLFRESIKRTMSESTILDSIINVLFIIVFFLIPICLCIVLPLVSCCLRNGKLGKGGSRLPRSCDLCFFSIVGSCCGGVGSSYETSEQEPKSTAPHTVAERQGPPNEGVRGSTECIRFVDIPNLQF